MQAYIVIAFNLIRVAVGSGLFDRISQVVRNLIGAQMSGDEKKLMVREFIKDNGMQIGGIALDAIIALTRLRFEAK